MSIMEGIEIESCLGVCSTDNQISGSVKDGESGDGATVVDIHVAKNVLKVFDIASIQDTKKIPRIFCGIFSLGDTYHSDLSNAQLKTWGKRCDGIMFYSNSDVKDTNHLNISEHIPPEHYHNMWLKVRYIWYHIYTTFFDSFDYFLLGKCLSIE